MGFLTLYRKYRPRDFNDLVGQKYIVRTLRNALRNNRVGHAYLFAGPRGTGKTSTAKVFARALNCQEEEALEPCGECDPCVKIAEGQSIDVVEIDAASNRGVDEIRELREKVKFYPGEGSYKVYIIDEVHMLTREAFNALLKTLEEPPESVVFILATTEPHKVIDTIHSRCQRFDFSLLSVNDIQQRLQYICENEEVDYEKKALNIIAHSSNGGLRDAISILDQAISYTNGEITEELLIKMLGKVERGLLAEFVDSVVDGDAGKSLSIINDLVSRGKGVPRFVSDLIDYCRHLLLIKECGSDSGVVNLTGEMLVEMEEKATAISANILFDLIEQLTEVEQKLKFSNQPRLILEIGIVKTISQTGSASRVREQQLQEFEERLSLLERGKSNIKSHGKQQDKSKNKKAFNKETTTGSSDDSSESGADKKKKSELKNRARKQTKKQEKKQHKQKEKQQRQDADNVSGGSNNNKQLTLHILKENWSKFLKQLKKEDIKATAYLREGQPVKVEENTVYIKFKADNRFHKKGAEEREQVIKKVFKTLYSRNCQLVFFLEGQSPGDKTEADSSKAGKGDSGKLENNRKAEKEENEEEYLQKVADMFDGQIIEVDPKYLST